MSSKSDLRKAYRLRRREQPEPLAVSRHILSVLEQSALFLNAQRVAYYLAARGEVDTLLSLQHSLDSGRELFVPFCEQSTLRLCRLQSTDELAPGAFGILEPTPTIRQIPERCAPVRSMDLILVPGVAFDRQGSRLGSGHGYYDRLLAHLECPPTRVGLAFECQLVDTLPSDPHDVKMHVVLTERQAYGPFRSLLDPPPTPHS